VYASIILLRTGDLPGASALIEGLIAYYKRYPLEPYRALGIAPKGELVIARDEPEVGLDFLRSALETLDAQRYNFLVPRFIGASAEGLRQTGRFEVALFTINDAIVPATNSGMEVDLAELLRIESQILAARRDREAAMNCLTDGLAVACAQSTLAWELRSTMALARLLCEVDSAMRPGERWLSYATASRKDLTPRISNRRALCLRSCDSN
jgi:hypothetical protein